MASHGRFGGVEPLGACKDGKTLGRGGGEKRVCNINALRDYKPCLIYSLGSDNDVSLEEDLLAINPACEIHTFDCTSNEPPAAKAGRLHFHKTCVAKADVVLDKSMAMSGDVKAGTAAMLSMRTIAQQLGDRTPALVKMDVEGWEWEVLNRWQPQDPFLPDMLALEVHGPKSHPSEHLVWTRQDLGRSRGAFRPALAPRLRRGLQGTQPPPTRTTRLRVYPVALALLKKLDLFY